MAIAVNNCRFYRHFQICDLYLSVYVFLNVYRYQDSGEQHKLGYEESFLETLQGLVRRLDRRLDQCEQRISTSAKAKEKVRVLRVEGGCEGEGGEGGCEGGG